MADKTQKSVHQTPTVAIGGPSNWAGQVPRKPAPTRELFRFIDQPQQRPWSVQSQGQEAPASPASRRLERDAFPPLKPPSQRDLERDNRPRAFAQDVIGGLGLPYQQEAQFARFLNEALSGNEVAYRAAVAQKTRELPYGMRRIVMDRALSLWRTRKAIEQSDSLDDLHKALVCREELRPAPGGRYHQRRTTDDGDHRYSYDPTDHDTLEITPHAEEVKADGSTKPTKPTDVLKAPDETIDPQTFVALTRPEALSANMSALSANADGMARELRTGSLEDWLTGAPRLREQGTAAEGAYRDVVKGRDYSLDRINAIRAGTVVPRHKETPMDPMTDWLSKSGDTGCLVGGEPSMTNNPANGGELAGKGKPEGEGTEGAGGLKGVPAPAADPGDLETTNEGATAAIRKGDLEMVQHAGGPSLIKSGYFAASSEAEAARRHAAFLVDKRVELAKAETPEAGEEIAKSCATCRKVGEACKCLNKSEAATFAFGRSPSGKAIVSEQADYDAANAVGTQRGANLGLRPVEPDMVQHDRPADVRPWRL